MNRINAIRLTAILALLVCTVAAQAQRRNTRYVEYIEKYAPLAVQQMKEHKIPNFCFGSNIRMAYSHTWDVSVPIRVTGL